MDEEVYKALTLPEVRYSRVWEDHRVLSKALCIQPQDVVLCITSSGDNVLNLLLDEPSKLIAIDMSEAQNFLLELKLSAIRCLCYEDFLILLGETEDTLGKWDEIYKTVKQNGCMPTRVQHYWDIHHKSLKSCGLWFGKLEKYILELSRDYLPRAVTSEQVDAFMSAQSLEEQRLIFDQWPTEDLKDAYCQFCSPSSQLKGRDPAQLKFVHLSEKEVEDILWGRLKKTCRNVPVHDNFYLSWFLRGPRGYNPLVRPDFAPPYLTREGFGRIKGLVDRVEIHTGAVEDYFDLTSSETPTKLALSNIFEYMSQESADVLFDKIATRVASGGRIAFWECFNQRLPSSESLKQRVCRLEDVSDRLCQEDRYCCFEIHVMEIK